MESAVLIAALGLGLASSLHCIGMCGPIAFSLGLNSEDKFHFILKNLIYQSGRVVTYSILGLVVGIFSQGISFAGFQKYISIIAGVLIIIMVVIPKNLTGVAAGNHFIGKLLIKLKSSLGKFIRKKSYSSLFITGLLNGLLPCGVVYVALTSALAVGNLAGSTLFMTLFGLGTIPLMSFAVAFGSVIHVNIRNRILKILPVITILIGLLFILRGLELGIPYISPPASALEVYDNASNVTQDIPVCH